MKRIMLTLLTISLICGVEVYQQILVESPTAETVSALRQAGLSLVDAHQNVDGNLEFPLSTSSLEKLDASGVPYQVIIPDLQAYFASRLTGNYTREFGYGSMGGYYTFAEIETHLSELHQAHPQIVSDLLEIGITLEGRSIWAICLSDNPEIDEDEPEILFTGLHHAREPMAMMNLFYFMNWLVENYEVDPKATALLNHREMWFVPCINPDGYVYNELIAPGGGGMHRKNRSPHCIDGNMGVDLNRNYGYMWGYDNTGSSPAPCEDTFRGPAPFSELENQAIRDFVEERSFNLAVNYHTWGDLILTPFSYDFDVNMPVGDQRAFTDLCQEMARESHYVPGNGALAIYPTNGDSDDWLFGEHGIYALTIEIGNQNDYFWAPTERIFPLAQEVFYSNQFAAAATGSAYRIDTEFDSAEFLPGNIHFLSLDILNRGLAASLGNVRIDIEILGTEQWNLWYDLEQPPLPAQSTHSLPAFVEFSVPVNAQSGSQITFNMVVMDDSNYPFEHTVTLTVGPRESLLFDDAENGMNHWNSFGWGIETPGYQSSHALADSPDGAYNQGDATSMILATPIDLSTAAAASLQMDLTWDTQLRWDFAIVAAGTTTDLNNIDNWIILQGEHSLGLSSVFGPDWPNYFAYRGQSDGWLTDTMDLSALAGEPEVYLLFQMVSNNFGGFIYDGISIDNLEVTMIPAQQVTPGDVNSDEVIDILDVVRMVNIIMGDPPTEQEILASDLNNDEVVDVLDVILLVNLIMADD